MEAALVLVIERLLEGGDAGHCEPFSMLPGVKAGVGLMQLDPRIAVIRAMPENGFQDLDGLWHAILRHQ